MDNDPFIRQVTEAVEQAARADDAGTSGTYEIDGKTIHRVVYDLYPEQQPPEVITPPVNFRITDDALGHGGQKTKYGYNVAAIRVLKQVETERRNATPDEQEILSRYIGWGSIPQAFDDTKQNWANEYAELKGMLTEKEYETARSTTLNAHYTSPIVIKSDDFPGMELCGIQHDEKAAAGTALLETCKAQTDPKPHSIGRYCGFELLLEFDCINKQYYITLVGNHRYKVDLGMDIHGNIQRLDNQFKALPDRLLSIKSKITELERQQQSAIEEIAKPFAREFELAQKQERLAELDSTLKIGDHSNDAVLLDSSTEQTDRANMEISR